MHLTQLHIENLRNIAGQDVALAPGFNLFIGPNGAGKTSVLEAAYLLSHAQSFRAGKPETLIRRGSERLALAASVQRYSGARRIGLVRQSGRWEARLEQATVARVSAVLRENAVVCFDPGAHQLICGASLERRRFLDWGVFHVEHNFLTTAARYRRVLHQRNAALKQAVNDRELSLWDDQMCSSAELLTQHRLAYFARFSGHANRILQLFLSELGESELTWDRGWPEELTLKQQLAQSRPRDRVRGHTTRGPHRADWGIRFTMAPIREQLSRGQEKLCALACILAQAQVHADARGEWPVVALDDLASELDAAHQKTVIDWLGAGAEQVLISGLDMPACLQSSGHEARVFHVEHGAIRSLL